MNKQSIISFLLGVLITTSFFGLKVLPELKAKDRSVSDELVRIEKKVDDGLLVQGQHQQAIGQIIDFINKATQAK